MKIIVRNDDNVVVMSGDNLTLDALEARDGNTFNRGLTTENAVLYDDVTLPENFMTCCYTYVSGEFVINQTGIDVLAQIAQEEAEDLVKKKQSLLDTLDTKQFTTLYLYHDKWMAKYMRADLLDDINIGVIKQKCMQVGEWGEDIVALNNGLTTDSTEVDIQAQIDCVDDCIELFPYLNQTDYDNDTLNFRS